jgi:tetratricopeptide (TPR) repeat protein
MTSTAQATARVERLLDAIELIHDNRRQEAIPLLRSLISEDKDYEDAWLWMSVAVESIDQSILCLDNVLRINPKNAEAAGALYRLRALELQDERKRASLRFYRDSAFTTLWMLIALVMVAIVHTYWNMPGQ